MMRETHQHGVSYYSTFPEAPLRLFLERCGQVLTLASKKNPPVGLPKLKVGNGPPRQLADVRKCAKSDVVGHGTKVAYWQNSPVSRA